MSHARVFTFNTWNVGDEMQSYAVLAHLQRAQGFADRDSLFGLPPGTAPFHSVMNSWFMIAHDRPRPPAAAVLPVWHGFCAGHHDLLGGDWLPYLRGQGQSIGCRDHHSVEILQAHGIPAHWTGCLTLFLGEALANPRPRGDAILFVDVPEEAEAFIPADIRARALRLSTFPPPSMLHDPLRRWAFTAWLADQTARAALVVTRRLHVALPAASFGTPVVAIPDPEISLARRRFSGFETILPVVFLDEIADKLPKLDWKNIPPARIPADLAQHRFALQQQLLQRGLLPIVVPRHPLLDNLDYRSQRLYNAAKLPRPGRIRLRLAEQVYEMNVRTWTDAWVDIDLQGFPGLRKLDFMVEATVYDREDWVTWGSLHDLVMPRETFL